MSDMKSDSVGDNNAEAARRIESAGVADETASYVLASEKEADANADTPATGQKDDGGESEAHPS